MVERNVDELRKLCHVYADLMANELAQNLYKGSWEADSVEKAIIEIRSHVDKLEAASFYGTKEQVMEYAADVGNQTMILLDVLGHIGPEDIIERSGNNYVRPVSTGSDWSS